MNRDERIKVILEAGYVERAHTLSHIGSYTVGQHCYGVASLILQLYTGEPSMELIRAALWHDTAERHLGDCPATAKWNNKRFAAAHQDAEQEIMDGIGIKFTLTREEYWWLKSIDRLELDIWAQHQVNLGNRYAELVSTNVWKWFKDNEENIPEEVQSFRKRYGHYRTDENLPYVKQKESLNCPA